MKLILYLSCVVLIYSCSTQKGVYWCGDHPCINKKERESYFKNNMIVEFKELKKKDLIVTNHYQSLSKLSFSAFCPNSEYIAKHIINIFIAEHVFTFIV